MSRLALSSLLSRSVPSSFGIPVICASKRLPCGFYESEFSSLHATLGEVRRADCKPPGPRSAGSRNWAARSGFSSAADEKNFLLDLIARRGPLSFGRAKKGAPLIRFVFMLGKLDACM